MPLISNLTENTRSNARLSSKKLTGFKVNHSTDTCLSRLTGMILNGDEKEKQTGMALIVIQRVFDTLDQKILLDKMKCIGFSDKTIKWFHSNLTNRTAVVSLDNVFLEARTINCGVPQGSVLGPLLFLLHINDITKAL